ncbi:HIT domain-containing protein [Candidatus Daviesbacteria bacterium]|nr:HIT domain-containing protein [Candidatus Daviesbacteria bacterium]
MSINCIFCKIIQGQIPGKVLDEDEDTIVILDLKNYPLVLTKKHHENIYELDEKTASSVMKKAVKIAKATKKALQAEGINLLQSNEAAAGQEVPHFHIHIKPRWRKDSVKIHLPNDVIEESIREATAKKIKEALK